MKKHILNILLLALFITNGSLAEDVCTVIGFHEPGTHTYDGPTFCEQVSINGIVVRGPLDAQQSVIAGDVDVSGPINAINTTFDKIISEDNKSQGKITLKKNSIVKHDIVFDGPRPGLVEIDDTSKINGKVINGTLSQI